MLSDALPQPTTSPTSLKFALSMPFSPCRSTPLRAKRLTLLGSKRALRQFLSSTFVAPPRPAYYSAHILLLGALIGDASD